MNSKIALALLIFSVLALLPSAASAGVVTCNGLPATIVGTSGDDLGGVTGSAGDDVMNALGGGDLIYGMGGNDTICGGDGDDYIVGGEGDDWIAGETGNDHYTFLTASSNQTDTVVELTGEGNDSLHFSDLGSGDSVTVDLTSDAPLATHTNRTINTGTAGQVANFEVVEGGWGNDNITGNAADNILNGGFKGNDILRGGAGNDTYPFRLSTSLETDTVEELAGEGVADLLDFHLLSWDDPVAVDLRSETTALASHTRRVINTAAPGEAINFEDVTGGSGNDSITGNPLANILDGRAGNDELDGGAGNDLLIGADGDDLLIDGEGDDSMAGGIGYDNYLFLPATASQTDTVQELSGEGTHDLLNFDLAPGDTLTVDLTSDSPIATHTNRTVNTAAPGQAANFEDVWNGAGNDNITGNAANNILWDWEGSDFMDGGSGDDVYYFFPAFAPQTETVKELQDQGGDWLFFSALVDGASITQLSLEGVDLERLRSREMIPQFSGEGGGGKEVGVLQVADVVHVHLRVDNPIAYHTNRTVKTAASGQALYFENAVGGAGNDVIIGSRRNNILVGGAGKDTLKGLRGADLLIGEDGNDTLIGGRGKDIGDGGSGTDVCKTETRYNCP